MLLCAERVGKQTNNSSVGPGGFQRCVYVCIYIYVYIHFLSLTISMSVFY